MPGLNNFMFVKGTTGRFTPTETIVWGYRMIASNASEVTLEHIRIMIRTIQVQTYNQIKKWHKG